MSLNVPYNELFDRETGLLKTKEELLARRTLFNNSQFFRFIIF